MFSYRCGDFYVRVFVFALQKGMAYWLPYSKNEFLQAYKSC